METPEVPGGLETVMLDAPLETAGVVVARGEVPVLPEMLVVLA
jgi:hypothetical protein